MLRRLAIKYTNHAPVLIISNLTPPKYEATSENEL